MLSHDGRDLAAALQTIIEIGDHAALNQAIGDAFEGAKLRVEQSENGHFSLAFQQHGLLRPLNAAELSDGTLRYILWVAALNQHPDCHAIKLEKELGYTQVKGMGMLDEPAWNWGG
jgi:predicted ATPase